MSTKNHQLAKIIEARSGEVGETYLAWLTALLNEHTSPLVEGLEAIAEETDARNCRGTAIRALERFEKEARK